MPKRKPKPKQSAYAGLSTARLALLGLLRSGRLLAEEVRRLERENAALRRQLAKGKPAAFAPTGEVTAGYARPARWARRPSPKQKGQRC